jgi:hypothetical protein
MYSKYLLLIPSLACPIFYVAFTFSKPLLELNQYTDSIFVHHAWKQSEADCQYECDFESTRGCETANGSLSVWTAIVSRLRLRVRTLRRLWHHPPLGNRTQEPLDDCLSLSQIRQGDMFIRQVRLTLCPRDGAKGEKK